MSQISPDQRTFILNEIETWRKEGLISLTFAQNLGKRYQLETAKPVAPEPTPPGPAAEETSEQPLQASPAPQVSPTAHAPSLLQTLTSEASIKVALYLGAFFVIAAALILAALVENLRLPTLLGVAFLFGIGALVIKKRLPQPSFILWLVFSALLPISAGVLADLLKLEAAPRSAYWLSVLAVMALVWAFSTWLYESRFFSLAAFGSIAAAGWFFADLFDPQPNLTLFTLAITALGGLAGAWLLREWRDQKFMRPLFITLQVYELVILLISFILVFYNLLDNYFHAWWLFSGLTWLSAFVFFALSDLILPFRPFSFLAAAALIPVAWLTLLEFDPQNYIFASAWTAWGFILASLGEIVSLIKSERLQRFATPLVLVALPLMVLGGFWTLEDYELLDFGLLLFASLVITAMHLRKTRWWVWVAGSLAWMSAYFAFFAIAPIASWEIETIYTLAGFIVLASLTDWLFRGAFNAHPAWRWPIRAFNLLIFLGTSLGGLVTFTESPGQVAIVSGILALVGLGYALRFNQPVFAVLFTTYTTAALTFALQHFEAQFWLPALSGLATLYYLAGWLRSLRKPADHWSNLFRWSGLALATILSVAGFFYDGSGSGWYIGALGILFVLETYRHHPWLEIFVHLIYVSAFAQVLLEAQVDDPGSFLLGISALPLVLDVFFHHTIKNRRTWKWFPRLLGGVSALAGNGILLGTWQTANGMDLAFSISYTLLLLFVTLAYRQPRLGYFYFCVLPITVLTAAGFAGQTHWTGILIGLSTLVYALSGFDKPVGWGQVRRHSGLAIATLTALSAPLENSGLWASLPVAIAATLWAIEAFRQRNVWLGFPANTLYLLAYFMILLELKVDQPQFFSVGAALLGLLMHYLLVRTGANTGAFITGMVSQLVLLSTTYFQMVSTNSLAYFAALFFQSLVVLVYGLVIRSRSLVFTPIAFVVLGVVTVVFSVLKGIATVILIGCTGILFIILGIAAVLMRERLSELRDRLSDWKA